MASDALSQSEPPEGRWGGPRAAQWKEKGKRAVVHVCPEAYDVATTLAKLARRSHKDFNLMIYMAGLEALTGQSEQTLCTQAFQVNPPEPGTPRLAKAMTTEEVKAVAQRLVFVPGMPA